MLTLKAWKTQPQAQDPVRSTDHAACWDLRACLVTDQKVQVVNSWNEQRSIHLKDPEITLFGGERALIPTGWIFEIPSDYSLRLHPRSGLAWKAGIQLANCEGVIDADYVHETFVCLYNVTDMNFVIQHGDRIAQMELVPVVNWQFAQTDERPQSVGNRLGGFGSTGVHL